MSKTSNYKKDVLDRLNIFSSVFKNLQMVHLNSDCKSVVLIWGIVSSIGLIPFRSDFVDYVKADIPVKDITRLIRFLVLVPQ